jgi:flagellar hook protein FlgE
MRRASRDTIVRTMSSLTAIALSGLQAAQTHMGSAAHNIANAATPAFRRQVVAQQTAPSGGVTTQIQRAPRAGEALIEDMVALKLNERLFAANLSVLRTRDRMLGTLLDVQA